MKRSHKTILIIIVSVLLIVASFLAIFFEFRDVPDYNWIDRFDYESKEPNGLWMFGELLKESYGEDNVVFNESDSLHIDNTTGNLYLTISDEINYSKKEADSLMTYVDRGNDVLFIASNINIKFPVPDSVKLKENNVPPPINAVDYEEGDYEEYIEAYEEETFGEEVVEDSIEYININRYLSSLRDSTFHFSFSPFDTTDSDFTYKHYNFEFDKPVMNYYRYIRDRNNLFANKDYFTPLAYTLNERVIFAKFKLGKGAIYIHLAPDLLLNSATRQDFYREHYNQVISNFKPKKVFVDKKKFRFSSFVRNEDRESPIQFILDTPPLAWAYFLTLFSLLLFVIFRSKRLQRLIPTIHKNENTSLQYVKTLSTLYQGQGQNSKLVLHMREVFYQKMKNKYFINPKSENYIELLSRKSKVDEKEIELLLHKFATARNSDYNDDQLIVLHRQLESFYKKAK